MPEAAQPGRSRSTAAAWPCLSGWSLWFGLAARAGRGDLTPAGLNRAAWLRASGGNGRVEPGESGAPAAPPDANAGFAPAGPDMEVSLVVAIHAGGGLRPTKHRVDIRLSRTSNLLCAVEVRLESWSEQDGLLICWPRSDDAAGCADRRTAKRSSATKPATVRFVCCCAMRAG
jgi:hypothetical protein